MFNECGAKERIVLPGFQRTDSKASVLDIQSNFGPLCAEQLLEYERYILDLRR